MFFEITLEQFIIMELLTLIMGLVMGIRLSRPRIG